MAPSDRTLSRRLALGMLTATAATGTSAARAENVQSLKSAAARAGLRFGATSDVDINKIVPDYARLFVTNCDFLALQMGWDRTQPVEHGPDRQPGNLGHDSRVHRLGNEPGGLLADERDHRLGLV